MFKDAHMADETLKKSKKMIQLVGDKEGSWVADKGCDMVDVLYYFLLYNKLSQNLAA